MLAFDVWFTNIFLYLPKLMKSLWSELWCSLEDLWFFPCSCCWFWVLVVCRCCNCLLKVHNSGEWKIMIPFMCYGIKILFENSVFAHVIFVMWWWCCLPTISKVSTYVACLFAHMLLFTCFLSTFTSSSCSFVSVASTAALNLVGFNLVVHNGCSLG